MHTIEDVNRLIAASTTTSLGEDGGVQVLSPDKGNVCFAASQHGWSFTLESFAHMYATRAAATATGTSSSSSASDIDVTAFAKRLWGDWYHDLNTHKFTRVRPHGSSPRTFVQYILDPLYKIYSQVIGEAPEDFAVTLRKLNIRMKSKELHLDPKPLLKLALSRFFGPPTGFVRKCPCVTLGIRHQKPPKQCGCLIPMGLS